MRSSEVTVPRRQRRAWAVWSLWVLLLVASCGGSGDDHEDDTRAKDAGSDASGLGSGDAGSDGGGRDAGEDDGGGMAGRSATHDDAGRVQEPDPDAGSTPAAQFPADDDADGDELDNGTELELGTDPRYRDTDMDGLADDVEVGDDPSSPLDGDWDGIIDALEHPRFDNDRDEMPDDVNPGQGVQLVYGRFVPAVLANDGSDSVRFELKLEGGDAKSVSAGMSATYHRDDWAPDELEVDGELVGDAAVELFDDGTHGDVIAGDHVFSRGGISTQMAIRAEPMRFDGATCRVLFNEISFTTSAGPQVVPIGTTDVGMPRVVPELGFWLPVLDATLVPKPKTVAGVGQRTDHVLNVIDPELAVTLTQILMLDTGKDPAPETERRARAFSFTSRAFAPFDADFDFVYAFTSEPVYGSLAGLYQILSNDVSGIGHPVEAVAPASGSAGRLRGLISFRTGIDVPINHETAHSWGVALQPLLGTADSHWGTAGTFGVLGGFDPSTLVDHGDGTFTVGHFYESGNDWRTTRFSPMELYLMGLVPPTDIAPVPVLDITDLIANETSGVTLSATKTTVTIDDITGMFGARTPATADARKDFASLFAIFSERHLSPAELGLIENLAANYERPSVTYGLSFEDASGGRATMKTALPKIAAP